MTRIQTNVASLRGVRSLANNNRTLNTSLTRLTTGLKINNGQDNPAGLIASETLKSQIAAIEQSISNSNRASNVIATADAALGEVSSLLIQVRGLIQEGINDGALSEDEKAANQLQIDSALAAINRISSNTNFGGDKLLDGSKSFVTEVSVADRDKFSDFRVSEATFGSNTQLDINARIAGEAERAELVYNGGFLNGDTTVEVAGSSGTELLFLGEEATVDDISAAINNVADATGVEARVQASGLKQGIVVDVGGTDDDRLIVREQRVSDQNIEFSVAFADTNGANSVTVDTTTTPGTVTITATLDNGATSGAFSTGQDLIDLVNGNEDAARYVEVAELYDGGGAAAANFVGGDAFAAAGLENTANVKTTLGGESFSLGATGDADVNVTFAQGGTAGVTVAENGTTTGQIEITVTADFSGGNFTVNDLVNLLANDTEASRIVSAATDGDGTGVISSAPISDIDLTTSSTTKVFGELQLYSSEFGSDQFVNVNTLDGLFDTTATATSAAVVTRDEGVDVVAYINGQRAQSSGLQASIKTSTIDASITFEEESNEIDEEATISVTGGGATFQIGQQTSVTGQIGVGIEAVNTARLGGASGKLYELSSTGGKSLLDVDADTPGSALVDIVEEAINEVSTLRGRLGALQKNVIETNVNSLGVALEQISEARSAITDTDFAVETANLTRAQILSQAGFQALQLANNNPQNVLSLLG